jgi:hypothetical protein
MDRSRPADGTAAPSRKTLQGAPRPVCAGARSGRFARNFGRFYRLPYAVKMKSVDSAS